ncbi:MAG TPA: peptidoglycan-binding domain-containing protein [Candidatus Paceibacterota bacterium]|nr:peptidoglycan-binding domain-containing protein [Candidatus Paceibacterota bacterium]
MYSGAVKKSVLSLVVLTLISVVGFSSAYGYGGSSGSSATRVQSRAVSTPPTSVSVPQQNGSTADTPKFIFTMNLYIGLQHPDVVELQQRLRLAGYFNYPTNTGFFGPITLEAVKSYQTANPEIGYVTGYVGPLTRAVLNK